MKGESAQPGVCQHCQQGMRYLEAACGHAHRKDAATHASNYDDSPVCQGVSHSIDISISVLNVFTFTPTCLAYQHVDTYQGKCHVYIHTHTHTYTPNVPCQSMNLTRRDYFYCVVADARGRKLIFSVDSVEV